MPSVGSAIVATAKFIAGSFAAVATGSATVAQTLTFIAVTTAVSIATARRPDVPSFEDPGAQLRPQRGGVIPRTIVYGETLVAGHIVFAKASGDDRKNLDLIIALGDGGPYESVEAVYFDEQVLTLDGSGNVTSPSKYNGFATILTQLGAEDQTANASAVSNISEWTTNHRGRGICYAYARLEYDPEVWTQGLPTLFFKVRGRKVYDPRLDSTNGGSGTHRKDDPTTWEFSQNKALWLLDWMRGVEMNGERVAGLDVPDTLIDWGAFADAADVCDEDVDVDGGGTIKRYTGGGGTVTSADDPKAVCDMFIRCMAGEWAPRSGYIGVYAGSSRTAAVTLTDDDLAGPIKLKTAKSVRETVNRLQATYRDPDESYELTDAPPYINSSWESDDGEIFEGETTLPFIDDHRQAQRICKLLAGRTREPRELQARFKQKAMQCLEGDAFTWDSDRFPAGVQGKYIVTARTIYSDGTVDIVARSETSGFYSWDETTEESTRTITGKIGVGDNVFGLDVLSPTDFRRTLLANLPAPTLDLDFVSSSYDSNLSGRIGYKDDVDFSNDVTGSEKPEDNATKSRTFQQESQPSDPTVNDLWYQPSTFTLRKYNGVAWDDVATFGADWTNDLRDRPVELTDGRITAGFDTNGDLLRPIPESIRDSSDLLGYAGGGLFSGDLNATLGADWSSNVTSRPAELTDGRITAALDSSGDLVRAIPEATLNSSNVLRKTGGGLFTGDLNATLGADWSGNVTNRPTELTDGRITTALDASGVLQTNIANETQIPALGASKITSGTFADARIAQSSVTQHEASLDLSGSQITSGTVAAARIDNLDAGKITTGTFADARIAVGNVTQHQASLDLSGSQITSGTVAAARIDSLPASQITSGTFADALIAQSSVTQHEASLSLGGGQITSGTVAAARIDSLPASQITSGTFADARIAQSSVTQHEAALDALNLANAPAEAAATAGADWTTNVDNIPTELDDGRVSAALDSSGDLQNDARVRQISGSTKRALGRALAVIEAQDGDSITFAQSFNEPPTIRILGGTGSTFDERIGTSSNIKHLQDYAAQNVTTAGFDVKAKIRGEATGTASRDDAVTTAGGGSDPNYVGDKSTADEAFDDNYTFSGTLTGTYTGVGNAIAAIELYTNDGTGWVKRATLGIQLPSSSGGSSINEVWSKVINVDGLGQHGGKEFGITIASSLNITSPAISSGAVTYESIASITEYSATPGLEVVFCYVFESDETLE